MELQTEVIIRIMVGLWAALFILIDFMSYCKQKINEQFAFGWGVFSVFLLVAAIVPSLSAWSKGLPLASAVSVVVLGIIIQMILFTMCKTISLLTMKNQELAMQVSLLNNENYRMLTALKSLTGKDVLDDK